MSADNVVTGARLVPGMTVRRLGLKDWFTVARIQRDGRTIQIHWHHTTEPTATNPRDRWEVQEESDGGQPENQPENIPGNIPANTSRPDPKACPDCGRPGHKCNTCGNEYSSNFHSAWQLHLDKAHTLTDGPRSATDAAREKLGLAEGEPATEVRAKVSEAMQRLLPTAATAGDPAAARAAIDATVAAVDTARGHVKTAIAEMAKLADGVVVEDPQPVDVVADTPQAAAGRIIDQARAERAEQRTGGHLTVYLYQPGAAITLTPGDYTRQHLLPEPSTAAAQNTDYRPQLAAAEDIFDQVAGWQLTPGGEWKVAVRVCDDQSVKVIASRPITRAGAS